MTLFEECLVALGNSAKVQSEEKTKKIFDNFTETFPITSWGRIDWKNVKSVEKISSIDDIKKYINSQKNEVYILWDEASLPVLKTDIDNALKVIGDIIAVSFDTWIFCPIDKYVIEFYHENEITVGFINN